MYSLTVLKETRIIISDGAAQEFGQLDNAIDRFFPNTIRVRCGWHLIDRSWEKHLLKKSISRKKQKIIMIYLRRIFRPGCILG